MDFSPYWILCPFVGAVRSDAKHPQPPLRKIGWVEFEYTAGCDRDNFPGRATIQLLNCLRFTNEYTDATGLLYLRARYYNPAQGRFFQTDPSRRERNPYIYADANPILHTDPSGLAYCDPGARDECAPEDKTESQIPDQNTRGSVNNDDRDLTNWLIRQLKANLNDPEIAEIRRLNIAAPIVAVASVPAGVLAGCVATPAGGVLTFLIIDAGAVALKADAYGIWISLVKDQARYDYKHKISLLMGDAIRLRHKSGSEWFDYSTPGNINYGFMGRAADFRAIELHGGASYAEICDPDHQPNNQQPSRLCPLKDGYWGYLGQGAFADDPQDYAAIELGMELYDRYGPGFTEADFRSLVSKYLSQLPVRAAPIDPYYNQFYGRDYRVGFFNGTK